jgi:hypothetical protein
MKQSGAVQNTWFGHIIAAAYYTTATTKPDNDVLTKRLKASIARLGQTSAVDKTWCGNEDFS